MRDLLATYEQDGEIDTHDANPFTDKAEPALIGEGYFRMECLAHLIDNPITVNLIGSNYENHGQLDVNIIPVDADGNEDLDENDIPDSPEDLLNRRIDFVVSIERARDLPSNFCKDVFVEYQIYMEETKYQTPAIEGKNRNPEFAFTRHHFQEVVTENFLKYIKEDLLKLRVLGFPDVKKTDEKAANKKKTATQEAAKQAMLN